MTFILVLGIVFAIAAIVLVVISINDPFDDTNPFAILLFCILSAFCFFTWFTLDNSEPVLVENLLNEYVEATSPEAKRDVIDDYFQDSKSTQKKQVMRDIDDMLAAKAGKVKSFEEIDRRNYSVILSCLDADGNPVGEAIAVQYSASTDKSDVTYHSLALEYSQAKK